MRSLQGHFLIASPHQLDPNFFQTAVLLVQHTPRSAFGLIVNGPNGKTGGTFWERVARQCGVEPMQLRFGGPVAGPPMALHTNKALGEIEVLPGLFFSSKKRHTSALIRKEDGPCKFLLGYAGWGPGQIEYELEQGVWRSVRATAELALSNREDLWEELSRQAFAHLLRSMLHISHVPASPLLN
jgi:putative transcriptional regulator